MTTSQYKTIEEISAKAFANEEKEVEFLLPKASIFQDKAKHIFHRAEKYVENIRANSDDLSIENFLKEYKLSTYEGVAILSLAEALLRVPDSQTADELIEDKLGKGNWKEHLSSESGLLMNSSTYGLMLSGEIINADKEGSKLRKTIGSIISRASEPFIRSAIKKGMEILGGKFVLGRNIENALKKADEISKHGYLFSYDMLGEGARTAKQADQYLNSYLNAIDKISYNFKVTKSEAASINLYANPNISVKLSALHPRFELKKIDMLKQELLPRLKKVAKKAMESNMWLSIDAEESWRVDASLILFEELFKDEEFEGYEGLGFVLQSYSKRAYYIIQYLKELSEKYGRKIPVRLVKGAYWDTEIKYAQQNGLEGYPVFTRKSHSDLSDLVCAKEMLDNPDNFYPQFASHSALTVSAIREITEEDEDGKLFEFQRLYGMGETFYEQLKDKVPCRIYAPVGEYSELLPYLIRRILENGASNSFVNLVVDENEPIGQLLTDPIKKILNKAYKSKDIPLPVDIYQPARENSKGYDLGNLVHFNKVKSFISSRSFYNNGEVSSIISGEEAVTNWQAVNYAIKVAAKHQPQWQGLEAATRIEILRNAADRVESNEEEIINLICYEGKRIAYDAITEVREAVDFLRFYAAEAEKLFTPKEPQKGYTGEKSVLEYRAKGVFAAISPWNFPAAIFIGQIAAALVTGNAVIAKPAEQTPMVAKYLVELLHKCGVPQEILHLIIGKGSEVGNQITKHPEIRGVLFTGSTNTANIINTTLAERDNRPIATLVAETGGQNCMIVDSTALLEKTCDDIIESAFGSAGQRCSGLRVAYIQEDIFDQICEMLSGALNELKVAEAHDISTDIAPVIDANAKESLEKHISEMEKSAKLIAKGDGEINVADDCFVAPHIFEIPSINRLEKENFGPVLHLVRFERDDIDKVIEEINSTGYGLTFGVQSRISEFIRYIVPKINAGNIYINRSVIGSIVETHPFGGMNLSGTGPKAGGHEYIKRFVNEVTVTDNIASIGGNLELLT